MNKQTLALIAIGTLYFKNVALTYVLVDNALALNLVILLHLWLVLTMGINLQIPIPVPYRFIILDKI